MKNYRRGEEGRAVMTGAQTAGRWWSRLETWGKVAGRKKKTVEPPSVVTGEQKTEKKELPTLLLCDNSGGKCRSPVIGASCWMRQSLNEKKGGVRSRVSGLELCREEGTRGGIMDSKKITLIRDFTLDRDDYMIKVRIIRLWKLTNFCKPKQCGGKIQCNVEATFIQRLGKLLDEYVVVYIENPTIEFNVGSYRIVDNEHKLYFYYITKVSRCNDFTRPMHGFSFAPFQSLIENSIPKDVTFNIIGDVVNLGYRVFFTLWQDYSKQMMDYVNANPEQTTLSIILQFRILNFYTGMPYDNNTFRASKLFINDKIDDILAFKIKLIAKSGDQSSSSHRTISSYIFYSFHNEFLSKYNFYKISAIHGLDEGSLVIVIGTIKVTEQEQHWFYLCWAIIWWFILYFYRLNGVFGLDRKRDTLSGLGPKSPSDFGG
ncbi:hypothetical protein LXL04_003806 [Taraxacum kok-saghyz]